MVEHADRIIDGIRLMMKALDVKKTIIGIENNKPDAVSAMTAAAASAEGIEVRALPVRYPQGGEKQLIYATTKRKVPCGGLPLDVGVVVANVGTCYAIDRAIREGRPLVERVTTVGGLVNKPSNFLVRIGTPISHLIEAAGGMEDGVKQVSGGPMMGMAISRTDIPVTKGGSGVLCLGREAVEPEESACIRAASCMRACPMNLAPAKLDSLMRAERYTDAANAGAMNCMGAAAAPLCAPPSVSSPRASAWSSALRVTAAARQCRRKGR